MNSSREKDWLENRMFEGMEMKKRIYILDGLIGAGKTTILSNLNKN
jgi:hypothetical protein